MNEQNNPPLDEAERGLVLGVGLGRIELGHSLLEECRVDVLQRIFQLGRDLPLGLQLVGRVCVYARECTCVRAWTCVCVRKRVTQVRTCARVHACTCVRVRVCARVCFVLFSSKMSEHMVVGWVNR